MGTVLWTASLMLLLCVAQHGAEAGQQPKPERVVGRHLRQGNSVGPVVMILSSCSASSLTHANIQYPYIISSCCCHCHPLMMVQHISETSVLLKTILKELLATVQWVHHHCLMRAHLRCPHHLRALWKPWYVAHVHDPRQQHWSLKHVYLPRCAFI
jgi:hypothetical protein